MVVAQDLGGYYRIPADNRDLNYALYFSEGREGIAELVDYNSHNVTLMDVDGMVKLLSTLELRPRSVYRANCTLIPQRY